MPGLVERGSERVAERVERLLQVRLGFLVPDGGPEGIEGTRELIADLLGRLLQFALGLGGIWFAARTGLAVLVRQPVAEGGEPLSHVVPCLLRIVSHRDRSLIVGVRPRVFPAVPSLHALRSSVQTGPERCGSRTGAQGGEP